MTGFRISKRCYADPPSAAFDGEGSRRRGGRWTPSGKRAAYASTSLALASLEYFVNLDPGDAPPDLVSVRIDIPESIRLEYVSIDSLPDDWRTSPFPKELQAFGAAWLFAGLSVCLVVPSAVIPDEHNLIVNPLHSDFQNLNISEAVNFVFDPRMWKTAR